MKRNSIILILILWTFTTVCGQTKKVSCNCPKTDYAGTKADTTFYLSNGKAIVLCGYKNTESHPITFSEFVLAVCGQDTIIGFWGAVLTCQLKTNKDTLIVGQLTNLPTGKNFKYKQTILVVDKIYFQGKKMFRKLEVNKEIKKYTPDEIAQVTKEYETSKGKLDEKKMELADRLFIAAISGDNTARQYFKEFEKKFGTLDGAFLEDYESLTEKLELWDKNE